MGGCQRPALTHSHMTRLSQRTLRRGHHCPLGRLSHFLPMSPGPSHSTALSGECLSGEAQPQPPALLSVPTLSACRGRWGLKLHHLNGTWAWLEAESVSCLGALVSASLKRGGETCPPFVS